MSPPDFRRYGRTMIVPGVGGHAQVKLGHSCVLLCGAGGLGCPAALYLAAAGVGELIIVDDDIVDGSNLARQIGHSNDAAALGSYKADSLAAACTRMCSASVRVRSVATRLTHANALGLLEGVHVAVDATDNVRARYVLSDACVLAGIPCVSASALGMHAQVSVYAAVSRVRVGGEVTLQRGPCYRCVHPAPPPADSVQSCSDAGVLGPVVGVAGSMCAMEAVKLLFRSMDTPTDVLTPSPSPRRIIDCSQGDAPLQTLSGRLCVYDGGDAQARTYRLRGHNPSCIACGDPHSRRIASMDDCARWCDEHGLSAAEACAQAPTTSSAPEHMHGSIPCMSVKAFGDLLYAHRSGGDAAAFHVIDVRHVAQFSIAHIRGSVNVPLPAIRACVTHNHELACVREALGGVSRARVHVLCRRGVDSVVATTLLMQCGVPAINVCGGLASFSAHVDASFPVY